jgi:2-polyprenyl-3-methyl-5-hydroxy-6-metoxy-1,4-benzoquinol methylase
MPNFLNRSYKLELLDRDDIPFEDIQQNMKELDVVNSMLGGHKITKTGLQFLLNAALANSKKQYTICEIGCGGGDNLRVLKTYCAAKNISANFIGVDINPHCIAFAKSRIENTDIEFICSDYKLAAFEQQPDIIFSSLFCHHFTDEQLVDMLSWLKQQAQVGFFINDLQRHWLAYYAIKIITSIFSKSYLVKNDAPLSVLRGFSKNEWNTLFAKAKVSNYTIVWKWAFRWLIYSK